MPYSERTFLLLGIGITLIGVGWWVLTHVPFDEEPQLLPAVQLPAPAASEPAAEGEAAAPEGAVEGDVEGLAEGVMEGTEPAPALEAPAEAQESPAAEEKFVPLESSVPEALPVPAPVPEAVAPESAWEAGTSYPLPESSVTPVDAGRDTPIQMVPLRTAPATETLTEPELSEGAAEE